MKIILALIAAAFLVATIVTGFTCDDSWKNVCKVWALLAGGATMLGILLTIN